MRLRQLKTAQKAIVFVDNLTTMKHLSLILTEQGYTNLTFSGSNSRDFSVIERFRNDKAVQILIATGNVTKGLDIEFCPVVVNYDLLSNALELEQRISRCHRQGQHSDVLVINLFGKENDADMRYLELINKRTLQFDGIFGLSDTVLGNFEADIDQVLSQMRPADEIANAFEQNLLAHEPENRELVKNSLDTLFTTFTKDIADKATVTPQYIEAEISRINSDLWDVVKWFFEDYNSQNSDCFYDIDDTNKTITAQNYDKLPMLFYYFTGSRNKPYTSLRGYGMEKDFKPHTGRITLASPIGKGVINSLEAADEGTLTVDMDIEPCQIGLYCVKILVKDNRSVYGTIVEEQYILAGKTMSGKVLTDEECRAVMELPVIKFTESDHKSAAWLKSTNSRFDELDSLVPQNEILQKYMEHASPAMTEEIEQMKRRTARQKTELEHALGDIRAQVESLRLEMGSTTDRVMQIRVERQLKALQKQLRDRENNLLMDSMRLDVALEKQISEFMGREKFSVKSTRHFILQVNSN